MEIPAHPVAASAGTRRRLYARAARDAFEALLRDVVSPSGRPILLPAYVGWSPKEGSGLFDPVRATGTAYGFYPLDRRLAIRREALVDLLDEREPAAVVLVHWFGVPEPATTWLAGLCGERGIVLIEDCAHGLGAQGDGRTVGQTGDYMLASLHKVLACRNGGFLQANAGSRLPEGVSPDAAIAAADLAALASADLGEIARRRRANYLFLRDRVAEIEGIRPFHDALPDGAVPLNLPVLVEDADRDEVYHRMRGRGVGVVTLYHTLVDALHPEEFPDAFRLSERIFNLPTHQGLGEADLGRVAEDLEEVMREAPERNRRVGG